MKQLINYIKEELESDNILWLLDQWFTRDEVAKEEFINIIFNCQKDHTVNNAEKYLNQTQNLKLNLQSFINFVSDEVNIKSDKDYIYAFKELLKIIINNKSNSNKYIK